MARIEATSDQSRAGVGHFLDWLAAVAITT
jgi:hypothetical protein